MQHISRHIQDDIFKVGANVNVFITEVMNEEQLKELWKPIRNSIAMDFQQKLEDEFERWNIYIFYVVDNKLSIDLSLEHMIEHDTISSRKIVVDSTDFDEDPRNVINKYLKCSFQEEADQKIKDFKKNSKIKFPNSL